MSSRLDTSAHTFRNRLLHAFDWYDLFDSPRVLLELNKLENILSCDPSSWASSLYLSQVYPMLLRKPPRQWGR